MAPKWRYRIIEILNKKEIRMHSRRFLSGICALMLSASTLSAAQRFTIEAKLKAGATPASYVCAVQVLEHPGGATVIENELTISAGKPAVARSGKQDGKGGEIDRKIECSLSADGGSALIRFTNTESRKGEPSATATVERRLKIE